MCFVDCHAHVFLNEDAPDRMFLVNTGFTDEELSRFAKFFSWFIPGKKDSLENLAAITKHLGAPNIETNYLELASFYPPDAKMCLITMDMRAIKGQIKETYSTQITKMLELKTKYPNKVLAFLHLDPNQPEFQTLFEQYILTKQYDGIKIYPPLDSCPNHENLKSIWKLCELNKIPIMTHTSKGGVTSKNFFNRPKSELANPQYWCEILEKYPRLYLNFSHFGNGTCEWTDLIIKLCQIYPNVYSDCSYYFLENCNVKQLHKYFLENPFLQDKFLYGSDFYVSDMTSINILENINFLKDTVGNEVWKKITETNPAKFLRL